MKSIKTNSLNQKKTNLHVVFPTPHFHLFDKNLQLIRSNNQIKINENDFKGLCWCSDLNYFLILTKSRIYLINPFTSKISLLVENLKLKD